MWSIENARVFSKFPHCSHILIHLLAAVNNAFQVNHHPLLCEPFNRRCCGVREKVEGGGVKDAVWSAPFSLSVRALRGEYHTDVYIKHDDHTSVVVERNKSQMQCHHVSIIQFCVDGFKLNLVNQSMMTSRANIAVKSFSLIQRSSITLCVLLHLSCMLTTRYNSWYLRNPFVVVRDQSSQLCPLRHRWPGKHIKGPVEKDIKYIQQYMVGRDH